MTEKETAVATTEPHPLVPLENQLNGSQHNASAAVRAVIDYFEKEIAKLRDEFAAQFVQKKGGRSE